jgi:hypothetical protein
MKKNPLTKGIIEKNAIGVGEVSSQMLAVRAKELALIAGRAVCKADQDQALRELTGGSEMDANEEELESLMEDERLGPVSGSRGHRGQESASEDEDEDGLSEEAQLFEEGVSEAEHDQMLQAAKAAKKKD